MAHDCCVIGARWPRLSLPVHLSLLVQDHVSVGTGGPDGWHGLCTRTLTRVCCGCSHVTWPPPPLPLPPAGAQRHSGAAAPLPRRGALRAGARPAAPHRPRRRDAHLRIHIRTGAGACACARVCACGRHTAVLCVWGGVWAPRKRVFVYCGARTRCRGVLALAIPLTSYGASGLMCFVCGWPAPCLAGGRQGDSAGAAGSRAPRPLPHVAVA